MTDANDKRDVGINGRRADDNKPTQKVLSSTTHSIRHWFVSGITVGGVIGALFLSGRASATMDSAVSINVKQDEQILVLTKLMYEEQSQSRELLTILKNQGQQTKESDERFEEMLKESNELQRDNREKIIILNQKISVIDKTNVIQLARAD
jgi:predicted RND superfamily exporter protein